MNYEVTKVAKGRGHQYLIDNETEIDGEKVERVTNILKTIVSKGGGFEWFLKTDAIGGFQRLIRDNPAADYTSQKPGDILKWSPRVRSAAHRGTAVHAAIELGNFTLADYHPDDQGFVTAAAGFHLDHALTPEAQELIIGSKRHRYAGTLDWRGTLDGVTALLDWKTINKSVHPVKSYLEHHLQLCAYEAACVEMGFPATSERWVVYLCPDGTYEKVPVLAQPADWLTALEWYRTLDAVKDRVETRIAA